VQDADSKSAAFAELALPLLDSLSNFARWLCRDRSEAEDLVQETMMKALKGFASFQAGTNFRAWVFRILRNTFLTSRTGLAAQRTRALDDEDVPEPAEPTTPESLLLGRADQQTVQAALEALPLPFREVLLLCDVEELSYQEIAATLSIPIGTVMSRLWRARRALRENVRGRTGGE
jgi:RNA polymerase sigma-70 factor (ECF subfamily)